MTLWQSGGKLEWLKHIHSRNNNINDDINNDVNDDDDDDSRYKCDSRNNNYGNNVDVAVATGDGKTW